MKKPNWWRRPIEYRSLGNNLYKAGNLYFYRFPNGDFSVPFDSIKEVLEYLKDIGLL